MKKTEAQALVLVAGVMIGLALAAFGSPAGLGIVAVVALTQCGLIVVKLTR